MYLILFTNEESPLFHTRHMGSRVYAKRSRERGEEIVLMLSLETIGYYSDERGSPAGINSRRWVVGPLRIL